MHLYAVRNRWFQRGSPWRSNYPPFPRWRVLTFRQKIRCSRFDSTVCLWIYFKVELHRANDITLSRDMSLSTTYLIFCGICVTILRELNAIVMEPYMVQLVSWLQPISLLTCWQPQGWTFPYSSGTSILSRGVFNMGHKDHYTSWTVRCFAHRLSCIPGIDSIAFTPQLFVVSDSETSVFIQLQRANATAYDAIVLAVTSHCTNAAFVLSQTREAGPPNIITFTGGDCSFCISNSMVFRLLVLHRSPQCIVCRLDGSRRFTRQPLDCGAGMYYDGFRVTCSWLTARSHELQF